MLQLHIETSKEGIFKAGYLYKRGHVRRNWKKRFFVLGNGTLKYYKDEVSLEVSTGADGVHDQGNLKDSIELSAATVNTARTKGEWKVQLRTRKNQKDLQLKTLDRREAEDWRIAIEKEIVKATTTALIDEDGRPRHGDEIDADAMKWYSDRFVNLASSLMRLTCGDSFRLRRKTLLGLGSGRLQEVRVALDDSLSALRIFGTTEKELTVENTSHRNKRVHNDSLDTSSPHRAARSLLLWLGEQADSAEERKEEEELIETIRISKISGVSIDVNRGGSWRTIASGTAISDRQQHGHIAKEQLASLTRAARQQALQSARQASIDSFYDDEESSSDEEDSKANGSFFSTQGTADEGGTCLTIFFWDNWRPPLHLMSESEAIILDWFHDIDSILQFAEIPPCEKQRVDMSKIGRRQSATRKRLRDTIRAAQHFRRSGSKN